MKKIILLSPPFSRNVALYINGEDNRPPHSNTKPNSTELMRLLMDNQQDNVSEMKEKVSAGDVILGDGAQFRAYISPSNDTAKYVTEWKVSLEQEDGNWSGTISSENPQQILQTPGLSGVFKVTVTAGLADKPIEIQLQPQPGSKPDVECNSNCAAMVGIVATPGGGNANYWTVWDAFCSKNG